MKRSKPTAHKQAEPAGQRQIKPTEHKQFETAEQKQSKRAGLKRFEPARQKQSEAAGQQQVAPAKRKAPELIEQKTGRKRPRRQLSPESKKWANIRRSLNSPSFVASVVEKSTANFKNPPTPAAGKSRRLSWAERYPPLEPLRVPPVTPPANDQLKRPLQPNQSANRQRINNGLPDTPPNYWDTKFPTEQVQKELGLVIEATSPLIKRAKKR